MSWPDDCGFLLCTSNKHLWELGPCLHFLRKYWTSSKVITVLGAFRFAAEKTFFARVPDEFTNAGGDWEVTKFSDGLLWMLERIRQPYLVLWFSDEWLRHPVDALGFGAGLDYVRGDERIAKLVVGEGDGSYGLAKSRGVHKGIGIFESDSPDDFLKGGMSPAVWRREAMLKIFRPGWTPWDAEIRASERIRDDPELRSMRYPLLHPPPALYKNCVRSDGKNTVTMSLYRDEDVEFVRQHLPEGMELMRE